MPVGGFLVGAGFPAPLALLVRPDGYKSLMKCGVPDSPVIPEAFVVPHAFHLPAAPVLPHLGGFYFVVRVSPPDMIIIAYWAHHVY